MSLGHHQAGDARDGYAMFAGGPGYPVNDAAAGDLHCPPYASCCAAAAIAPAFEPALPQVVAAVPEASVQQSFAAGVPERSTGRRLASDVSQSARDAERPADRAFDARNPTSRDS